MQMQMALQRRVGKASWLCRCGYLHEANSTRTYRLRYITLYLRNAILRLFRYVASAMHPSFFTLYSSHGKTHGES